MRRAPAALGALAALALAGAPAGCTGQGGGASAAADRAPHAGAYPVATPQPQASATPAVSAGGYALVAAGDPVRVSLPGAELLVRVAGPDVVLPTPVPGQPVTAASAPGTLTVSVQALSGSADVDAAGFLALDQVQHPIALAGDAPRSTASPGHPVSLHLRSTFAPGHTTLTWRPLGRPLVTWDFVVEMD